MGPGGYFSRENRETLTKAKLREPMHLIVQGKRPRSQLQVFRYVDGPKLMMTCTKRGVIHMYQCFPRFPNPSLTVEDWRKLDAHDSAHAIARLVTAGYDPIEHAERLTALARARRTITVGCNQPTACAPRILDYP